MELRTASIIDPLLVQIENECDQLKSFIKTRDFPYHKLRYYDRIVEHASAMLLLAGEIKALHQLDGYSINLTEYSCTDEQLIEKLSDCTI